jgi:RNA polymerase sigma-70 factor, ECF subfamily
MVGSLEESEDLVQETFLRAWHHRERFQGRSTFRAWLYQIATNACLDLLARRPRRVLPYQIAAAADPNEAPLGRAWLRASWSGAASPGDCHSSAGWPQAGSAPSPWR